MYERARQGAFFARAGCSYSAAAHSFLKAMNFQIDVVISQTAGEALPPQVHGWRGDWIFCFRSYFILPQTIIDAAEQGAINFHPAPTNYRGRGCLNFALYEGAADYGVTTHLIEKKVDSGPVLRCDRFPIFPGDNVDSLLQRTHHHLLSAFYEVVGGIALQGCEYVDEHLKNNTESWSGPLYKLSQLNALQNLEPGAPADEVARVIRATHTSAFPTQVQLHGHRFDLRREDDA